MHSRDQERERLESNDPQPGMSRFDRGWEAANGVNSENLREPRDIVDDLTMTAGALTARQVAIYAGDRTSARAMFDAAEVCKRAADEIERLRAELARYKRMYCRMACRDLYASGVKWKTKPNKMRTDGVFIEEDCEPGRNRTWAAFPIQFAHDDAAQIVELLNRAADELAMEAK